ncbi:hypothetical protein GCM10027515_11610 [Schumannella luteola]|uniref:Uncharacterized protein n=1 Tax=Schumannella luteola TaxID=472059 RepID=A0A852YIK6_9MICO|nr:hypothetical protein [Schumannella luteola]NYG97609.1 hypothetical protein [Schumannella luteola]TPX04664.1 hypothetical protein FJ656_10485 [Schumannella luteola]
MSDATAGSQSARTRAPRRALLIAAGVIALAILAAALALPGLRDSRDVASLLASSASIDPVEATAELCTRDLPCVEAYRTEVGDFLRFGSSGEAEYWATVLGDAGRRSGATVLDLREVELSADQKRLAIDTLLSREDGS